MHVYMHIYIHVHIDTIRVVGLYKVITSWESHAYIQIHVCVSVCLCANVCIFACMCANFPACICVCVCVCACVCVCVYVRIYFCVCNANCLHNPFTHSLVWIQMLTWVYTYVHILCAGIPACLHTPLHTLAHMHTNVDIHTDNVGPHVCGA